MSFLIIYSLSLIIIELITFLNKDKPYFLEVIRESSPTLDKVTLLVLYFLISPFIALVMIFFWVGKRYG